MFLDTLFKRNNGEISVLVYRKPRHIRQYLHYNLHREKSCKESVVLSLFNRAYFIITSKDHLTKEKARTKQKLKKNWYRESIINKIFRDLLTIPDFLGHNNKCKSKMSKKKDWNECKVTVLESTNEKLGLILRSHKIRSTFYTESTLCKLLCKLKDRVATEDKNNITYEIGCSNCKFFYLSESKRCLKSSSDGHKRYVRNCNCEKNEIAQHCCEVDYKFSWDQKKVVDGGSRLIPRKIKETIRSLKNPNNINKFSTCFLKYGFLVYVSS